MSREDNLLSLVSEAGRLGAAQLAESLGLTAGEISQRKARSLYGKWFTDAEKAGRIRPVHIDQGGHGTRHYRVVDIQDLKTADLMRAELQLNNNNKNGLGEDQALPIGIKGPRTAGLLREIEC